MRSWKKRFKKIRKLKEEWEGKLKDMKEVVRDIELYKEANRTKNKMGKKRNENKVERLMEGEVKIVAIY